MENIILGQEMTLPYIVNVTDLFSFPVKKIKMKDVSKNNMDHVIMGSRSQTQSVETEGNDSNFSVDEVKPVQLSILENTQKLNVAIYNNQYLYTFSSKPIRLTDAMYTKVNDASLIETINDSMEGINADSLNQEQGSISMPVENENYESMNSTDSIVDSVNASDVQNAVEEAFNSGSEMKKVGYAGVKARVNRFTNPKVGHINDNIFSTVLDEKENSKSADKLTQDDSDIREFPVVVPERTEAEAYASQLQDSSQERFVFDSENYTDEKENNSVQEENSYLDELKQYEKTFKDVTDNDLGMLPGIISFEEAKANIEKARELSRTLDAQARVETEKLQKAMDKCNEELDGYRSVCEQVKTYIVSYQEANREKEERIDDLVAKRQEQEAKAANYAHQREEIASLISPQDSEQSVHIKRMAA